MVIAQQACIAFLGLAIIGTRAFALGYYFMGPILLFVVAGIFLATFAAAGLLTGSARDFCRQRAALLSLGDADGAGQLAGAISIGQNLN